MGAVARAEVVVRVVKVTGAEGTTFATSGAPAPRAHPPPPERRGRHTVGVGGGSAGRHRTRVPQPRRLTVPVLSSRGALGPERGAALSTRVPAVGRGGARSTGGGRDSRSLRAAEAARQRRRPREGAQPTERAHEPTGR